ncbi:PspC domain-containing protein [Plebeiibacterium sediminum]|uniref:PspC domain-containing protein n=1 Tax=Plebeiibacterium sediminum TaxID=2992112 RepID=A0AAE3M2P9_9BACT|nr:PspC domain-containing protein [Plebeiobacterium sediminum]MCW3785742.1 PspC domain-containing protein [Plebeiobacterium sediminum]
MKKTIYINLNGYAFHIEEDAYDRLSQYLDKIERSFSDPEEAKEIIADIESRIAEIFRSSHPSADEVITLANVEEVIKTMGEPQDIVDEDEVGSQTKEETKRDSDSGYSKRLYRDPDNRVIGGVCGGLGAYFNVDPIVFRAIFLVAFIIYGSSLLPYIILWIVMPKAVTIKQKLEMKGPAGYEKWEQNLKNEYKDISDRFTKSRTYQNFNKDVSETSDKMGYALRKFIGIIGGAIGIVIMVSTLASLVAIILAFTVGYTLFDFSNIGDLYTTIPSYFLYPQEVTLGTISVIIIAGVPLLILFLIGFKLVFKFKTRVGLVALISIVIWIGGWVMLAYTSAKVAKNYSDVEAKYTKVLLEETRSQTIYFKPNENTFTPDYKERLFEINRLDIYASEEKVYVEGDPKIEIKRGPEFQVTIKKSARGSDYSEARKNCDHIEYFWMQKDSIVYIDPIFTLTEGAKIRDQKIQVVFTIPENYKVDIADELDWHVNSNLN